MYSVARIIVFSWIIISVCQGQGVPASVAKKRNLIFYIESSDKKEFLAPEIENILADLKNSTDNTPVFREDSLNNLNLILESKSIESTIISEYLKLSLQESSVEIGATKGEKFRKIQETFKKYNEFLKIKINSFQSLLEFQFILFEVYDSGKKKDTVPVLKTMHKGSSVFINPGEKNYKEELIFAIKQIFPETNKAPDAIITARNYYEGDSVFYTIPNDTLYFESSGNDADSPKDKISYEWKLYLADSAFKEEKVVKTAAEKMFVFLSTVPGNYIIKLNACDGLATDSVSRKIKVLNPFRIFPTISNRNSIGESEIRFVCDYEGCFVNYNNYIKMDLLGAADPQVAFKLYNSTNSNIDFRYKEIMDTLNIPVLRDTTQLVYKFLNSLKLIKPGFSNFIFNRNRMGCINFYSLPDKFNLLHRSNTYYLLSPVTNPGSSKYYLEIAVTDKGRQNFKKLLSVSFFKLSRFSFFYQYSNMYPKLNERYSTFYNNQLGISMRLSYRWGVNLSIGTLTDLDAEAERRSFKVVKVNFSPSVQYNFIQKSVNVNLKLIGFLYPYNDENAHSIYQMGVGLSPELLIPVGYKIKLGLFGKYFPKIEDKAGLDYVAKLNIWEIGAGFYFTPFKKFYN